MEDSGEKQRLSGQATGRNVAQPISVRFKSKPSHRSVYVGFLRVVNLAAFSSAGPFITREGRAAPSSLEEALPAEGSGSCKPEALGASAALCKEPLPLWSPQLAA